MVIETVKLRKGQPGGLATRQRHGREHYSRSGKMGGRPRSLTIEQIRQQAASSANKKEKEEAHGKGKSLKELKRLLLLKQGGSSL